MTHPDDLSGNAALRHREFPPADVNRPAADARLQITTEIALRHRTQYVANAFLVLALVLFEELRSDTHPCSYYFLWQSPQRASKVLDCVDVDSPVPISPRAPIAEGIDVGVLRKIEPGERDRMLEVVLVAAAQLAATTGDNR